MQSRSWYWRRLTDEQLTAAAEKWSNLAGEAHYAHMHGALASRESILCQILDELRRREQRPTLFEDRPGFYLGQAG